MEGDLTANGIKYSMFQWYLKLKMMESMTISINIVYYPIIWFGWIECALDDFYLVEIHSTSITTLLVGSKNRKKYFIYGEQCAQVTCTEYWFQYSNVICFLVMNWRWSRLYVKTRMVFLLYLLFVAIAPIVWLQIIVEWTFLEIDIFTYYSL